MNVQSARLLLIVQSGAGKHTQLQAALADLANPAVEIEAVTGLDVALASLVERPADVVIIAADGEAADEVAAIEAVRRQSPRMPIVLVAPAIAPDSRFAVRRAGAQHVVLSDEALEPLIVAIVRDVINDRSDELLSAEDEIRRLGRISGPTHLSVTGRSLGTQAIVDKDPAEFHSFLAAYLELLDLALERQTRKLADDFESQLQRFAESLGIAGAGPRDVIAIHKAAISGKVAHTPSLKTRAYCQEGRLLVLQVMGHLVSFYRTLSWGRGPGQRLPGAVRRSSAVHTPRG